MRNGILIPILVVAAVALWFLANHFSNMPYVAPANPFNPNPVNPINSNPSGGGIACTMEAKLCPDGSYVGRGGPNCDFAPCPPVNTTQTSGVTGTVTLSPTCPVERMPPDPNCAPKPYATSISITMSGSTQVIKTIQSNGQGMFITALNPGSYILHAQGGNTLPRCGEVSVQVSSGQYTNAQISCDTGIR